MCTLVMLMRKRHLAANFLFNGSLIYAITSALILECNGLSFVRGEGVVSRKIHLNQNCCPQGCLNLCQVSTFVSGVSALWTLFILWHLQACHNFSYWEEAHQTNEISHKTLSISLLPTYQLFFSKCLHIFLKEMGILTVFTHFPSAQHSHNWDL